MLHFYTHWKGIGNNGGKILKKFPKSAISPKTIDGKFVHYEHQKQNWKQMKNI
jgi:hypothetical protein